MALQLPLALDPIIPPSSISQRVWPLAALIVVTDSHCGLDGPSGIRLVELVGMAL